MLNKEQQQNKEQQNKEEIIHGKGNKAEKEDENRVCKWPDIFGLVPLGAFSR